jgi:Arm DNA-binding domain
MATRISRDPIYRRRRFSAETIELCVRGYITYRLSYRDLVAMMAEREIVVSHTTIMRWVLQYVPEYERRPRAAQSGRARYPWKLSFGGNLYLLVMPKGGRYWHYCYRYSGKRKTLSLGTFPDVPIARARSRHLAARQLLAAGVDPSLKRGELRRVGSGVG